MIIGVWFILPNPSILIQHLHCSILSLNIDAVFQCTINVIGIDNASYGCIFIGRREVQLWSTQLLHHLLIEWLTVCL